MVQETNIPAKDDGCFKDGNKKQLLRPNKELEGKKLKVGNMTNVVTTNVWQKEF